MANGGRIDVKPGRSPTTPAATAVRPLLRQEGTFFGVLRVLGGKAFSSALPLSRSAGFWRRHSLATPLDPINQHIKLQQRQAVVWQRHGCPMTHGTDVCNPLIHLGMDKLAQCLRARGIERQAAASLGDMRITSPIDSLTRREQTVLQWLIEGLRDKDIGPLDRKSVV